MSTIIYTKFIQEMKLHGDDNVLPSETGVSVLIETDGIYINSVIRIKYIGTTSCEHTVLSIVPNINRCTCTWMCFTL